MGKKVDLTNKRFGNLIVLGIAGKRKFPNGSTQTLWSCLCGCGNTTELTTSALNSGKIKSCGCLSKTCGFLNAKYNYYDLTSFEYGVGYTNKGEQFYFDKEDYDKIKNYCWYINQHGYVVTGGKQNDELSGKHNIPMHRLVLDFWDMSFDVDHICHNKADNRKETLRICTRSQNLMNRSMQSNNTSGVTGVYWDKCRFKWKAQIMVNQKTINIGRYNTKEEAIKARKEAEIKYFGEYRYTGDSMEVEVCPNTESNPA